MKEGGRGRREERWGKEEEEGGGAYSSSVVGQLEVSLVDLLGFEGRLDVVGRLAVVVLVQLLQVGVVRGLREETLLVQQSQDAHWLRGEGGGGCLHSTIVNA